jgi:hypothetical protein
MRKRVRVLHVMLGEVTMNNLAGFWVSRFLVEYLISERNYTPNT